MTYPSPSRPRLRFAVDLPTLPTLPRVHPSDHADSRSRALDPHARRRADSTRARALLALALVAPALVCLPACSGSDDEAQTDAQTQDASTSRSDAQKSRSREDKDAGARDADRASKATGGRGGASGKSKDAGVSADQDDQDDQDDGKNDSDQAKNDQNDQNDQNDKEDKDARGDEVTAAASSDEDAGSPESATDSMPEGAEAPRNPPSTESCCNEHASTGCDNPDIQACVCDKLDSCCSEAWGPACTFIVKQKYCQAGVRECVCGSEEGQWQQTSCCDADWTQTCDTVAELKCGALTGCN